MLCLLNGAAFAADTTAPIFSAVAVSPSEVHAGLPVTIGFTVSEQLVAAPRAFIDTMQASFMGEDPALHFTFRCAIPPTTPPGSASLYLQATDLAGNIRFYDRPNALTVLAPPQRMPIRAWPLLVLVSCLAIASQLCRPRVPS